jgi:alpha-ketoglutarate-dependent 2,4-dichlorophenoxyacetate dioxygenase
MALTVQRVGPCFAGLASGVDLSAPLTATDAHAIHQAMDEHAVLVFRGQQFSDEQHMAFSHALGPLEPTKSASLRGPDDQRLAPTFADVSNLDKDDQPFARDDRRRLFAIGNRLWHSDSSFKTVPAKYSILHAISLPNDGGNTQFADMRAAYDALDNGTREVIEGLVCEHSQMYSRQQVGFLDFTDEERERFAPVRQSLVRIHPSTGKKSIYLSSHAGSILGWPIPEARIFLRDLVEHATQPQFVYQHQWQLGDLILWDNRRTMHRARPFPADQPRDMRRTTLAGEGPTAEQAA